jgi:hypothetical protein
MSMPSRYYSRGRWYEELCERGFTMPYIHASELQTPGGPQTRNKKREIPLKQCVLAMERTRG